MSDDELKQLIASLAISQKETERQIKEMQQATDKQINELGKQIGGLGEKFGSFTEGMAFPSMRKILLQKFGMDAVTTRDAAVLYKLATQVVQHLRGYLTEEQIPKVLRCYQRDIAKLIHNQMQAYYWEEVTGYEVKISKGFSELKCGAYTHTIQEPLADYQIEPTDKNNIHKYLFNGFTRCLCSMQKFDSDPERKLAIILDRDTLKWLKPIKGQIPIFYRQDGISHAYQPDFIAEATKFIYMLEVKRRTELTTVMVINKQQAAIEWCKHVTQYNSIHGGKPWQYVLIPHDEIAENISLAGLVKRFGCVE